MRLVEPTKVCKRCGERKPWGEFYTNGNGYLQANCKVCDNARRIAGARKRPELKQEANRRYAQRLRRDPERHATHLARRRGTVRIGPRRLAETVDAGPFAAWFERILDRDDTTVRAASLRLGLPEKAMRLILGGKQTRVELSTVERALIADDTITLRELYSDLYAEAAA